MVGFDTNINKCSIFRSYLVKEGLVQSSVLSFKFVYFLVELGFDVGTFDLQVL